MRGVRWIIIALCVVAAMCALVLYPLSYRHRLFVGWQRMKQGQAPDCHSAEVFVMRGSVGFEAYARDTFWLSTIQLSPPEWWDRDGFYAGASRAYRVAALSPKGSFDRFGFHWHHENSVEGPRKPREVVLRHTIVAIPLWLVLVLTLAPPAMTLVRFVRTRRRAGAMRCPDCGYDVRATPHRCPECGRNISPASPTTTSS